MEQGDIRRDPGSQQAIDQAVIKIQPFFVGRPVPAGRTRGQEIDKR